MGYVIIEDIPLFYCALLNESKLHILSRLIKQTQQRVWIPEGRGHRPTLHNLCPIWDLVIRFKGGVIHFSYDYLILPIFQKT